MRKTIGENIRRIRNRKGWTQERLATRSGLSLNFIGNLERGNANVSADSLERIAKCLGVPAPQLVTDMVSPGDEGPSGD
ncbi:MAG: helix-turn-helix transcriptional regulator [Bacteroidetes bacterium]|nr:helix-turn-helix transcriptional regulator [Bacteroidota bacterium]